MLRYAIWERQPNGTTSTGSRSQGAQNRRGLVSPGATMMSRRRDWATIFPQQGASRPLIRSMAGSISSAPSIVISPLPRLRQPARGCQPPRLGLRGDRGRHADDVPQFRHESAPRSAGGESAVPIAETDNDPDVIKLHRRRAACSCTGPVPRSQQAQSCGGLCHPSAFCSRRPPRTSPVPLSYSKRRGISQDRVYPTRQAFSTGVLPGEKALVSRIVSRADRS